MWPLKMGQLLRFPHMFLKCYNESFFFLSLVQDISYGPSLFGTLEGEYRPSVLLHLSHVKTLGRYSDSTYTTLELLTVHA